MPRPGYVLCAASGAIDQFTNAVSLFGIVETIEFQNVQAIPGVITQVRVLTVRAVETWGKEEGDADEHEFQSELIGLFPQQQQPVVLAQFHAFRFLQPFQRLIVPEMTFPPIFAPGVLRVESRLRRSTEENWRWRQSCEILIQETPPPTLAPPRPPANEAGQP